MVPSGAQALKPTARNPGHGIDELFLGSPRSVAPVQPHQKQSLFLLFAGIDAC
jgi:hypothetical protein